LVNSELRIKGKEEVEILKPGMISFWMKEEYSGSDAQGY